MLSAELMITGIVTIETGRHAIRVGGVTLPGMIDEPIWRGGKLISLKPSRGVPVSSLFQVIDIYTL